MTLACRHCFGPLTRGRCTRCSPRSTDGVDAYFDSLFDEWDADGDPDARRAGQLHGFWSDAEDCDELGRW